MPVEKDEAEVGALWIRQGRKGEFLSGKIEGIGDVICFPIQSSNPKAPQWRVLKSQPRDAQPPRERVPMPTDDELGF